MTINKLPVPTETLDTTDSGLAFQGKINSLFQNQKNSIEAYNSQIDAGNLAEQEVAKGLAQMTNELMNVVVKNGYNQFDADRAAGLAKYAASGYVHIGQHETKNGGHAIVNQGLAAYGNSSGNHNPNEIILGSGSGSTRTGDSETQYPVVNITGMETAFTDVVIVKLPPPEEGKRTYNKATGEPVTHASAAIAFAAETADIEVVTDRVDMWGIEAFLNPVTASKPWIYAKGCVQSQATDISGVATSVTTRPASFHAQFEGDTSGSASRDVDWFAANTFDREAMFADKTNNLYLIEGEIYQWCIRFRTFAGHGNGDWLNVESASTALGVSGALSFDIKSTVAAQGLHDNPLNGSALTASNRYGFNSKSGELLDGKQIENGEFGGGIYTGGSGAFGHCYFLVGGTVNRLNLGAACQANHKGSAKFSDSKNWHETIAAKVTKLDAFTNQVGGTIASGISGRPDGKFADGITASGQGGVARDMRLSAHDMRTEEWQAGDASHKNGEARGIEKEVFTKFSSQTVTISTGAWYSAENGGGTVSFETSASTNPRDTTTPEFLDFDSTHWLLAGSNGNTMFIKRVHLGNNVAYWPHSTNVALLYGSGDVATEFNTKFPVGTVLHIGAMKELETSVGGEFSALSVLGNPLNITANPDLKDGWAGYWLGAPDGINAWNTFRANRTAKSMATLGKVQTDDNGVTWISSTHQWDNVNNSPSATSAAGANRVELWNYTANAKVTKPVANAKVHQDENGLGDVYVTSCSDAGLGALFAESLISKVLTGANSFTSVSNHPLTEYLLFSGNISASINSPIRHAPIGIASTSGPAVKVLSYRVNNNGAGYIHYAATELNHDGTDWADDGLIHLTVGHESTLTDLNNKQVKNVAHRTEQLGWIKNNV
jgi:hypothetical protein